MCANINLFMEVNEEEFEKYLQTFVTDVWHLLMQVGNSNGCAGRLFWCGCGSQVQQLHQTGG